MTVLAIIVSVLGFSVMYLEADAYLLLQVRKHDANHSNVDAFIHKVVPSEGFDKMAKETSRKQFTDQNTMEMRSRGIDEPGLESIVFAINTGASKKFEKPRDSNTMAVLKSLILAVAKKAGPILRAKSEQYDIKPEIVNFRSKGKPSMMFEVNSKSIVTAIKDLLSSEMVRKNVGSIARKAAIVYRAMKDDLLTN